MLKKRQQITGSNPVQKIVSPTTPIRLDVEINILVNIPLGLGQKNVWRTYFFSRSFFKLRERKFVPKTGWPKCFLPCTQTVINTLNELP